MYINFRFLNGSNPFIAKDNETLFQMLCKYDAIQETEHGFFIIGRRQTNGNGYKLTYSDKKEIARQTAINWQDSFSDLCYSWDDLAKWADFFEYIGKKYGLMTEFRENAIL